MQKHRHKREKKNKQVRLSRRSAAISGGIYAASRIYSVDAWSIHTEKIQRVYTRRVYSSYTACQPPKQPRKAVLLPSAELQVSLQSHDSLVQTLQSRLPGELCTALHCRASRMAGARALQSPIETLSIHSIRADIAWVRSTSLARTFLLENFCGRQFQKTFLIFISTLCI